MVPDWHHSSLSVGSTAVV